jgi:perosamine synthetase
MNTTVDLLAIIERLRGVLPPHIAKAPLHEPLFGGNEWTYVKDCLDTRWVSSVGAYVERFEQELVRYTGAKHAVATVNGTAALHTCLMLLDVRAEDEVLLPSLTFVATANAVAYCGAVPHFVDVEPVTLGVDAAKLDAYLADIADIRNDGCFNRRSGRRMRALIVMHSFGHPADMDALEQVCRRYKLELVEDAAESLGSFYKSRHTGTLGRIGALSFNGNKIATCGGGGAILTNDTELARRAKHITTTAKLPHAWQFVHDEVGFNYRLPNLNAALGLAQLEQLESFVERKRVLAQRYQDTFAHVAGVSIFREPPTARSNYWLNLLVLDSANATLRDRLLNLSSESSLYTRPLWTLMHQLPMYRDCPRMDLRVSEDMQDRIVCLPSSVELANVAIAAPQRGVAGV